MKDDSPRIAKVFRNFGRWFDRAADWFDKEDSLLIRPYRGYANAERLMMKGRVLENENLFNGKSESEIRNIIENLKRFDTDELSDARVAMHVNNQTFETITDEEGYFLIDAPWEAPLHESEDRWLNTRLELPDELDENNHPISIEGELYFPSSKADYGIISDIDDTVLQTHVTSRFRLKMLYATFMKNAHQRLPMEGVVDLFNAFVKGGDGKQDNPIFYVSSSPWNIYDLLAQFMELQQLPKGPILLRDYGIRPSGPLLNHKIETISHILNTFSDLPFIMLGDTASKDADYYLELAKQFPGRIKAVYIRQTRDTRNARRMARLIEEHTHIDAVLVHRSKEIEEHARRKGILPRT